MFKKRRKLILRLTRKKKNMLSGIYTKIKGLFGLKEPLICDEEKLEQYRLWEEGFLMPFLKPTPNKSHQSQKLNQVVIFLDLKLILDKLMEFGDQEPCCLDENFNLRKSIELLNLCEAFRELATQLNFPSKYRCSFEQDCLRSPIWVVSLTSKIFSNDLQEKRIQGLKRPYLSALGKFTEFESFCFGFQLTAETWPIRRLITLAKLIIIYNAHVLFYLLPENQYREPFYVPDGVIPEDVLPELLDYQRSLALNS